VSIIIWKNKRSKRPTKTWNHQKKEQSRRGRKHRNKYMWWFYWYG